MHIQPWNLKFIIQTLEGSLEDFLTETELDGKMSMIFQILSGYYNACEVIVQTKAPFHLHSNMVEWPRLVFWILNDFEF